MITDFPYYHDTDIIFLQELATDVFDLIPGYSMHLDVELGKRRMEIFARDSIQLTHIEKLENRRVIAGQYQHI
jgi:hypothetical protein